MRCLNGDPEQENLLDDNRNPQRNCSWKKFAFYLMGINIVFFIGGLSLLAVFGFESRTGPSTTENPSPFIPTTSPEPKTTSVTSSTSTTGTSTKSSTETTSNSNELHFEMSEWENGHCEGNGQCPCHWVETRYCQAINSGTSQKVRSPDRPRTIQSHDSLFLRWCYCQNVRS